MAPRNFYTCLLVVAGEIFKVALAAPLISFFVLLSGCTLGN